MNPVTKVWENVERRPEYYELRSCYPDLGITRHTIPLKAPAPRVVVERSQQSILAENLQWIRIDMQLRLLKQRIEAGIKCQ